MEDIYISGTGVWTPPHKISNDELVKSFNQYVDLFNTENADQIKSGSINALEHSSSEFIVKASGIKSRYVIEKDSLLDPMRMKPLIKARADDELSFSAEVSVKAAKQALENADLKPTDIDCVIVMTVVPGFGGQKFMHSEVKKITELDNIKKQKNLNFEIEVDGGINYETGKICRDKNANVLVAGSYIFSSGKENYKKMINSLR